MKVEEIAAHRDHCGVCVAVVAREVYFPCSAPGIAKEYLLALNIEGGFFELLHERGAKLVDRCAVQAVGLRYKAGDLNIPGFAFTAPALRLLLTLQQAGEPTHQEETDESEDKQRGVEDRKHDPFLFAFHHALSQPGAPGRRSGSARCSW